MMLFVVDSSSDVTSDVGSDVLVFVIFLTVFTEPLAVGSNDVVQISVRAVDALTNHCGYRVATLYQDITGFVGNVEQLSQKLDSISDLLVIVRNNNDKACMPCLTCID